MRSSVGPSELKKSSELKIPDECNPHHAIAPSERTATDAIISFPALFMLCPPSVRCPEKFIFYNMVLGTGFEPVAFALRGRRLDRFDQPSIDERVVPADRVELSSEPYHGSVLPMN